MDHKNLDDILEKIPELQCIVNASYSNSKKDGTGRKHGELTKNELYSYTKCLINNIKSN